MLIKAFSPELCTVSDGVVNMRESTVLTFNFVRSSPVSTVAAMAESCRSIERRSAVTTICSSLVESSCAVLAVSAAFARLDSATVVITPKVTAGNRVRARRDHCWQWNVIVQLPQLLFGGHARFWHFLDVLAINH